VTAIEADGLRMRYGRTDVLHDVTFWPVATLLMFKISPPTARTAPC
jgi:hypothetical protein